MVHKHVPPGDDPLFDDLLPPFTGRLNINPIPKNRLPETSRQRTRRTAHPRRVDPRRQLAAEPRDVRDDVDGARGRTADGRDVRQEHDRQGRVPADGGDRAAVRQHRRRPLPRAGRRATRSACRRSVQRGRHARRHGDEVALAGRGEAAGLAPTAQPGARLQRAGRVGEVLPLLGRRAPATCRWSGAVTWSTPTSQRAVRREHDRRTSPILGTTYTGEFEPIEESTSTRRLNDEHGFDIPLHIDAARRLRGAVPAPDLNGTSACRACSPSTCRATSTASSTRDRVGRVARRGGPARGPGLPRGLPRRRQAHVHLNFSPRATRSWVSTTTSCASAATGTAV